MDEMFLKDVAREVERARKKFPGTDGVLAALTEEVGELAKAVLDEGQERVYAEAIQVAAMALRVAVEGDPTLAGVRAERVTAPKPWGPVLREFVRSDEIRERYPNGASAVDLFQELLRLGTNVADCATVIDVADHLREIGLTSGSPRGRSDERSD